MIRITLKRSRKNPDKWNVFQNKKMCEKGLKYADAMAVAQQIRGRADKTGIPSLLEVDDSIQKKRKDGKRKVKRGKLVKVIKG